MRIEVWTQGPAPAFFHALIWTGELPFVPMVGWTLGAFCSSGPCYVVDAVEIDLSPRGLREGEDEGPELPAIGYDPDAVARLVVRETDRALALEEVPSEGRN